MKSLSLPAHSSRQRFEYLPVAFFGSVMGLVGLSVAWKLAHAVLGMPRWISSVIGIAAVLAFFVLVIAFASKLVTGPNVVKNEFLHPISGNLFGTICISLLLLPLVISEWNIVIARVTWILGAVTMTLFSWWTVSRWIGNQQQVEHATPAWIVPVVGMLDVPLAIPVLEIPGLHYVMVFATAIGLFFTIPLFTMIFSRLVFQAPIPDAMQPSLLILAAPFSVGFSAYVTTIGKVDLFAESLLFLALFMLAVLIMRLRNLARCCPFRVSWWAVSFPLAASAVASLNFFAFDHSTLSAFIALVLLAVASLTTAALAVKTLAGIFNGELRTLSA